MFQKKIASTVYRNHLPFVLINGKKFILEKKDYNFSKKNHYSLNRYIDFKKNNFDYKKFDINKIKIRKLSKNYVNEVIELLEENISSFKPNMSHKALWNRFKIKSTNTSAIVAIYKNIVVGYGSITFENKIRGGVAGHIEEIVTINEYRKHGVGKKIMDKLFDLALKKGCYKVVLQSNKESEFFYTKLGFIKVNISMSKKLID